LKFKTEGVFDLADILKAKNQDLKPIKLVQLMGLVILGKEGGAKRLRSFLGYEGSPSVSRKWYALRKQLRSLKYDKNGAYQTINEISRDLVDFESIKVEEIKEFL